MNLDDIEIELTLNAGKYEVRMKNAGRLALDFARTLGSVDRSVRNTERHVTGLTGKIRDWTLIIGQARNALHQIHVVTTQWMHSIIKTNAEVERMTYLMKGLSNAASEAERLQDARDTLDQIFDLAKNAPFSINALNDTFVKMKSVGIDPLEGAMQSLVDATAAFGGTDQTLHRASIAIQQMAGKGVISMEELRQQLGEAVPQAIGIMARELGVTYGELVAEISTGNVAAGGALDALFKGFERNFGGRAQAMMETYNGQVSVLRTNMIQLVTQNTGMVRFFNSVTDALEAFNRQIEDGAFNSLATGVGNTLANMVDALRDFSQNAAQARSFWHGFILMVGNTRIGDLTIFEHMRNAIQSIGESINWLRGKFEEFLSFMGADSALDEMLRQRMMAGAYIGTDEIDRATTVFGNQGAEVQRLTKELERLKILHTQLEGFDPDWMQADISNMDPAVLQQMDIYMANGQRTAAQLAEEISNIEKNLDRSVKEFDELGKALESLENRSGQELAENFLDLNSLDAQIQKWTDELNAGLDAIINDATISEEEAIAKREALYIDYYAKQIAGYEEMAAMAQATLQAQGVDSVIAAELVAADYARIIANLQNTLNSIRVNGVATLQGTLVNQGGGTGTGSRGGVSSSERAMERLQDMMEDAQKRFEESKEALVNPFAFEVPAAIERTRERLQDLADDLSGGQITAEMQKIMDLVTETEVNKIMGDLQETTREARRSIMGERGARRDAHQEELRRLESMKQKLIEMGVWRVEHERTLQENIAAIQKQYLLDSSPIAQFANEWRDLFTNLEDFAVDSVKSISGEIARMVTEGEADFASLARSALASFLQININAAISGIGSMITSAIGASFGASFGGGAVPAAVRHDGGMVGQGGRTRSVSPSVFAGAPRMHTGGIMSGEYPTILKRGEGVFTPEQMRALGMRASGSAKTATVNVINNSGMPMEAEQQNTRFDGESMILDVVLRAATRPGRFHDAMKGVMK